MRNGSTTLASVALLSLPLLAAWAARDATPAAASAATRGASAPRASDSADAATTVHRFHDAIAHGDSTAALALLAQGVTVLESGAVESLAEYRAHHLAADIEFARAVDERRAPVAATVQGDVAWTVSTSTSRGTFRERAVDSQGAELMVLRRTSAGWRIAAIHWSSRRSR